MKRLTYSILAFIISIFSIQAQKSADAQKLISNLLATAKTTAIKTNFSLIISEKNPVNSQSGSGTFVIKANKFALEMDEMKVWFDGKTQWSYLIANKEVSITEPSEKELGETNPMAILSDYKNKCNIRFSKTKSTQNYIIEMTPKIKNKDFTKVEVGINKTTENLASIKVINVNGSSTLLSLSNYQKGIKVTDETFAFDKSKFKGVVVNDLR